MRCGPESRQRDSGFIVVFFNLKTRTMSNHPAHHVIEKTMYKILLGRIPAIKVEFKGIDDKSCSFKVAAFFASYTKKQIQSSDYIELKKCFQVADDIVRLSSTDSKQAIENVYVFALQRFLDADPESVKLLPPRLKKVYERLKVAPGN